MDCDRVRELLSDYLEEALADGDRAAVAAHLDGCARCAAEAEGLSGTIALLSALPAEKAPPELFGRIMAEIGRDVTGTPDGGKRLTVPRFKIPVEAAAAVVLLLLVYGIQRGMPVRTALPRGGNDSPQTAATPIPDAVPAQPGASPLPGTPPSPRLAAKERRAVATPEKIVRTDPGRAPSAAPKSAPAPERAVLPAATVRADSSAGGPSPGAAKREAGEFAAAARGAASAMNTGRAGPAAPAAPPARALAGVTVLPAVATEGPSPDEETVAPKVFAAPPSRMFKTVPYGREVTLEVASAEREGIEERIVAAAQRFGGGVHPGIALRAERAQPLLPGAVRVHLPRDSAGAFLDALKEIGTIPPEGMPAGSDLPAGPAPGTVSYTVRIRVR